MLRSLLRCVLIVCFALIQIQSVASETASAMVLTQGLSWMNGTVLPSSQAMFDGDLLQTGPTTTSNISATGSSVAVLPDSLVKFEVGVVDIQHGVVRVATSRALAAKIGGLTVVPAGRSWTVYTIENSNGHVVIVADKGDVTIRDPEQETTTLSQGQQTTREEKSQRTKKRGRRGDGATPAARGGFPDSTKAIVGGGVVIGGLGAWVALQDRRPLSPSCPTNCP